MYALENPIRPYAWGSPTAIPDLLGVRPTGEPQAELWMGAHPADPSYVEGRSLLDLITADPEAELGDAVRQRFGDRLPFLLKLLAAAKPLSLQAHPNPLQAREGYERENAAGIPLDAPNRNYKDPYAKPEMIRALSPLEALVGFRTVDEAAADARELGVAAQLAPFLDGDLRTALGTLLALDRSRRRELVDSVLKACATSNAPIAELLLRLGSYRPGDPGVVAALLMNRIVLQPGEAVFLPAGNLHAYLTGFGVELLANSDNVLRGGLTPKHIDVPELLSVLDCTPGPPEIVRPERSGPELVYDTPAPEFRMSVLELTGAGGPVELPSRGPQILVCTAGAVYAADRAGSVRLTPGRSAYAGARDGTVTLSGDGTVFRATAGEPRP
jgi:mannose-6-phosphate isomerase